MTHRYGIDTSVLVRLATRDPQESFHHCVRALTKLIEVGDEVFASNQVIGEAYVAVQHHYGVSKNDARTGLIGVLTSGLVEPLSGPLVLRALQAEGGCGLIDRLISLDYARADSTALTLDRRMATLPGARRL